jgi:hypothetical protein
MTIVELIFETLDSIYPLIPGTDDDRDAAINERFKLFEDYKTVYNPNREFRVDYADPLTRFAYLYRYVTCHADAMYNAITVTLDKDIKALFANSRDTIKVTCLGGGPGSDLFGIIKGLQNIRYTNRLQCTIFDKEAMWADSWGDIDERLNPEFRLSTNFQTIDVTEKRTWMNRTKIFQSDLFTMVYFISEVKRLGDAAEPFFKFIFEGATAGTQFLYLDNDDQVFTNWFLKMAAAPNLEVISNERESFQLGTAEEKRELGVYFKKFGSPKLGAKLRTIHLIKR